MNTFVAIHQRLWQSFQRLPLWVRIWMAGVLIPVNMLSLLLLQYPSARMVALAAVLALGSNMWLLYRHAGFTRLMAVPHLLVWGPLQAVLVTYLATQASMISPAEVMYISLVLAANGISLCFDLLDSWRWVQGEREPF